MKMMKEGAQCTQGTKTPREAGLSSVTSSETSTPLEQ